MQASSLLFSRPVSSILLWAFRGNGRQRPAAFGTDAARVAGQVVATPAAVPKIMLICREFLSGTSRPESKPRGHQTRQHSSNRHHGTENSLTSLLASSEDHQPRTSDRDTARQAGAKRPPMLSLLLPSLGRTPPEYREHPRSDRHDRKDNDKISGHVFTQPIAIHTKRLTCGLLCRFVPHQQALAFVGHSQLQAVAGEFFG